MTEPTPAVLGLLEFLCSPRREVVVFDCIAWFPEEFVQLRQLAESRGIVIRWFGAGEQVPHAWRCDDPPAAHEVSELLRAAASGTGLCCVIRDFDAIPTPEQKRITAFFEQAAAQAAEDDIAIKLVIA
jgi:hypothetical protein